MPQTLHALLVGIDTYPSGIPKLKRSEDAVKEVKAFLESRIKEGVSLHMPPPLINTNATKKGIINRFRSMSAAVRKGDVFLFYYAGHGSQEYAPQELCKAEEDGILETLLCVDSRNGDQDLADKELACLIHEVRQAGNVHFTAIMDCCHSGDNTRKDKFGNTVSNVSIKLDERHITQFYGYTEYRDKYPPRTDHIALAACQPDEEAIDGVFSECLLETLRENVERSYNDIISRAGAKIKAKRQLQTPGIFPAATTMRHSPFLDGVLRNIT